MVVVTATMLEGTVDLSGVQAELQTLPDATVLAKSTSDGAGPVTFPDVPPGSYIVEVTRPGFVANRSTPFQVRVGEVSNVLVDVQLTFGIPPMRSAPRLPHRLSGLSTGRRGSAWMF